MTIASQCVCSILNCLSSWRSSAVIPTGRGGGVAAMVCIKFNIQKGGRGRGGGVSRIRPGSPAYDSELVVLLRGLDWQARHRVFDASLCCRQLFVLRLMGPDECLRGRSPKVYKGRTIELQDTPDYFVQPPPKRRRMRQLTFQDLIRGGWGNARGAGGKTKVARGGKNKTKVARGGGGQA